MARPSPVPPYRRVVEASIWLNDWNSRSSRSGAIPMPVSRTENARSYGRAGRRGRKGGADREHARARLGELPRVREQVEQHLAQAGDVADDRGGHAVAQQV